MENLEVYDLTKLRWVFWAMLTFDIAGVLGSVANNIIAAVIFLLIIQGICVIIFTLGVRTLRVYSQSFRKGYEYIMIAIYMILFMIICSIASIIWQNFFARGILMIVPLLWIIVLLSIGILQFCVIYCLLKGIEDIASKSGENEFAEKIDKFWYIYIWTMIITAVVAMVLFATSGIMMLIILAASAVVCWVVNIMLLAYINKAYKLFNGREIPREEELLI